METNDDYIIVIHGDESIEIIVSVDISYRYFINKHMNNSGVRGKETEGIFTIGIWGKKSSSRFQLNSP